MPVKKNVYVVFDVISRKVCAGVAYYMIKTKSSSGGTILKWVPSYDVSNNEKIVTFEKIYKKSQISKRDKRLKDRNQKKTTKIK